MPSRAPSSTWSFTGKSNERGVPQRCCSALPLSSLPFGTDSCGIFGMPSAMASICALISSRRTSEDFSSSPMPATSAIRAETSSPLPLAWPIAFERVLRRFCSSCVRAWICLRSASMRSSAATSSWKPRVARSRSAVSANWPRSRFGSSMIYRIFLIVRPRMAGFLWRDPQKSRRRHYRRALPSPANRKPVAATCGPATRPSRHRRPPSRSLVRAGCRP